MKCIPQVLRNSTIGSGSWLELNELIFTDSSGTERKWENITRNQCLGAVAIIPCLKPSNRLILIRQYRPPADSYVIEFPAGLIDGGETAESTAIRELYEETGYTGTIKKMTMPVYNSPGLTSETVNIAIMDIQETDQCNINPEQHLEDGEDIETIIVPITNLQTFIAEAHDRGDAIDSKVMSFVQAYEMKTAFI